MSDKLKPVCCGCGGEAEVDCLLQPDGFYMAGCYCKNCGTKTIPFWDKEKAKAIDYAVTTWNRAMGERTAKVVCRGTTMGLSFCCGNCGKPVHSEGKYCHHCGAKLDWSDDE